MIVDSKEKFELFMDWLNQQEEIAFDTETKGLHGPLVGMSFANFKGKGYYLPVAHETGEPQLDMSYMEEPLQDAFNKVTLIGWNMLYEKNTMFRYHGIKLPHIHEAQVMGHLSNENLPTSLKNRAIAEKIVKKTTSFKDVVNFRKGETAAEISIPVMAPYAIQDAILTWQLKNLFWDEISNDPLLLNAYNVELRLVEVIHQMFVRGVKTDVDVIKQIKEAMLLKIAETEAAIYAEAGEEFNMKSSKQKSYIMYEKLGIPVPPKCYTPKGAPQTNKSALEKLRKNYPIAKNMLIFSKLQKVVSSFTDSIIESVDSFSRIRPSFNQTGTVSGRMSCVVEGTPIEVLRNIEKFPDGIPIEQVEVGSKAYSYDGTELTIKNVLAKFDQGHSDDVYEIRWKSTGGVKQGTVRVTGDHLIGLVDGSWKKAKDLSYGDRALSLSRDIESYGYPRLYYRFGQSNEHSFIARSVLKYDPQTQHVHHKDHNKLNNSLSNLTVMSNSDHTSHHAKELANTPEKRAKSSEVLKQLWAEGKMDMHKGPQLDQRLSYSKFQLYKMLSKVGGKLTNIKDTHDFQSFKNLVHSKGIDPFFVKNFYDKQGRYISRGRLIRLLEEHGNYDKVSKYLGLGNRKIKFLKDYYKLNNHMITEVVKVEGSFKIWDLEIEDTHNFIAGGIKVHNCRAPNFQQMPKGGGIRRAFIADPGYKLIVADYSQLELRVAAHFSQDPVMMEAFQNDLDLHTLTASKLFHIPFDKVEKEGKERFTAKCVHPDTWLSVDGKLIRMGNLDFGGKDQFKTPEKSLMVQTATELGTEIKQTYSNGDAQRIALITKRGIIVCSEQHRLKMQDGSWKNTLQLQKGDLLAPPERVLANNGDYELRRIRFNPWFDHATELAELELGEDWAYLSGAYTGDGAFNRKGFYLVASLHDGPWLDSLCDSYTRCGLEFNVHATKTCYKLGVYNTQLFRLLKKLELVTDEGKVFRVPEWVMNSPERVRYSYLAGIIDTDGTVQTEGTTSVTTKDLFLAQDLSVLMNSLGLEYSIEVCYNKTYEKNYYRIHILSQSVSSLVRYLRHPAKQRRAQIRTEGCSKPRETIWSQSNKFEQKFILDEGPLYDIALDDPHEYLANGLVTHNTINFGIIYGMGAREELGVTWDIIADYFKIHSRLKRYILAHNKRMVELGYTRTLLGRKRQPDGLHDPDWGIQKRAERQGFSTHIQGSAGDVVKLAMVNIFDRFAEKKIVGYCVAQVHDELIYEVRDDFVEQAIPIIQYEMENSIPLRVPLEAEPFAADNWEDAKKGKVSTLSIQEIVDAFAQLDDLPGEEISGGAKWDVPAPIELGDDILREDM